MLSASQQLQTKLFIKVVPSLLCLTLRHLTRANWTLSSFLPLLCLVILLLCTNKFQWQYARQVQLPPLTAMVQTRIECIDSVGCRHCTTNSLTQQQQQRKVVHLLLFHLPPISPSKVDLLCLPNCILLGWFVRNTNTRALLFVWLVFGRLQLVQKLNKEFFFWFLFARYCSTHATLCCHWFIVVAVIQRKRARPREQVDHLPCWSNKRRCHWKIGEIDWKGNCHWPGSPSRRVSPASVLGTWDAPQCSVAEHCIANCFGQTLEQREQISRWTCFALIGSSNRWQITADQN